MKEPTYRQTLIHAWEVVWHNKALWILGLFSVLLGQLGFGDIFGQIWSMSDISIAEEGVVILPAINLEWPGDIWSVLGGVWLIGICLSLLILLVFLAVTSQGALISYAADLFKTKKHQKLVKSWNSGLKHFWSIFFVNILRKILLFLLLVVFGLILNYFISFQTMPQGFIFAAGLVLVLLASLFFSIISIYTLCALVIEGKGFVSAIKKSWVIFSRHVLVSLEVGILLMLLNFLLIAIIAAAAFFAFLPAILIWLAAGITNTVILAAVGLVLGIFLLLALIVLIAGFFNAYTTSAWVFLFMKMHKEGIPSRLVHLFKHLFK